MCEQFRDADSQEKLDETQRPVVCFITFETEKGKNTADMYNSLVKLHPDEGNECHELLGEKLKLQEASEPTDIIWENRQITKP